MQIIPKKQSLIERLKSKIEEKNNQNSAASKRPKQLTKKRTRMIEIGWVCSEKGNSYTHVRTLQGGGTRRIQIDRTSKVGQVKQKAVDFFFPNGMSTKGPLAEFDTNIVDYQLNELDHSLTIDEYFSLTGLTKLRFYLATKQGTIKLKQQKESRKNVRSVEQCHASALYQSKYSISSDDEDDNDLMGNKRHSNSIISCSQEVDPSREYLFSILSNEDDPYDTNTKYNNIQNQESLTQLPADEIDLTLDSTSSFINVPQSTSNQIDVDFALASNIEPIIMSDSSLNEQIVSDGKIFSTFEDVLKILRELVDYERSNTFNVFREEIFTCCVRAMRRQTFSPYNKIFVKFSDIEGISEEAIDEGGPTRELFRLVLNFIKDSPMFVGNHKKHISLNALTLNNKHYYEAGRIIALSLVHGGSAPHFFSDLLFSLLVGEENVLPTFEDVNDEIKSTLQALEKTEILLEAQNLMTNTNIFSIAGYNFIFKIEEKPHIIQGTLKFYAVNRIREPLSQFIEGLKTCKVYDYFIKYPNLFKSHMCDDVNSITAEDFENLFAVTYSDIGSNTRKVENKIITYFRDYLLDCEATHENSQDQDSVENHVTLRDILIFATGADQIPPLGFPQTPQITFLHQDISMYPKANTCALQLKLPVVHNSYEEFTRGMEFGIANCNSFGFA